MWYQQEIHLPELARGFHLVTDQVARALPCLDDCSIGMLHPNAHLGIADAE